jgi:hypothetical protein
MDEETDQYNRVFYEAEKWLNQFNEQCLTFQIPPGLSLLDVERIKAQYQRLATEAPSFQVRFDTLQKNTQPQPDEIRELIQQLTAAKQTINTFLRDNEALFQNFRDIVAERQLVHDDFQHNYIDEFEKQAMEHSNKLDAAYLALKAKLAADPAQRQLLELLETNYKARREFLLNIVQKFRTCSSLALTTIGFTDLNNVVNEFTGGSQALLRTYQNYIDLLKLQKKERARSNVRVSRYPRIDEQPVVKIFELDLPLPVVDLKQPVNILQQTVKTKFARFMWPVSHDVPRTDPCKDAKHLNLAQKLSYHYMHPHNTGVNVLLHHSAGSGKSCTAALIISIFARAGYTIILASKKELAEQVLQAGIDRQCDFNVQQFTQGQGLLEAVRADIGRGADAKLLDMARYGGDAGGRGMGGRTMRGRGMGGRAMGGRTTGRRQQLDWGHTERKRKTWEDEEERDEDEEEERDEGEEDEENEGEGDEYTPAAPAAPTAQLEQGAREYIRRHVFDQMGIKWYLDALSYEMLGNLRERTTYRGEKVVGTARAREYLQGPGTPLERTKDLLYMCLVVIDEAHKLVAPSPDKTPVPPFHELRDMFWTSYEQSKQNAVRLLLLTATPVAQHALDAVNLATLLAPRDLVVRLGLDSYAVGVTDPQVRATTIAKFMQEQWDSRTKQFRHPDKLRALFNGRISYFNYSGDTRFAQPVVTFVDVKLSLAQVDEVLGCLKIAPTPTSSAFTSAPSPPSHPKPKPALKQIASRASGLFTFNTATQTLHLKHKLGHTSKRSADGCLGRSVMGNSVIRTLVEGVKKRRIESSLELDRLGKHNARGSRFYKQYIFNDLVGHNKDVGIDAIEAALRRDGYHRVNEGDHIVQDVPPYQGMMVFDKTMDPRVQRKFLDYFNSSENHDGRHAMLFLATGKYKEGIDLKQIKYAHIAGLVHNQADLVQAVARAIRNCSRNETFYEPGRGWSIYVDIYAPSIPNTNPPLYPQEILAAIQPGTDDELAVAAINQMMRECAYDRLLLRGINDMSARNEQTLRLWRDQPTTTKPDTQYLSENI